MEELGKYILGTSYGIMVSKLNLQAIVCRFDSHWMPYTSIQVQQQS